jgi:hypothetical protein
MTPHSEVKLTKRMGTVLGIAASIESVAGMRDPTDLRDAISRLAIIEADAVRIQRLIQHKPVSRRTILSQEGRK